MAKLAEVISLIDGSLVIDGLIDVAASD